MDGQGTATHPAGNTLVGKLHELFLWVAAEGEYKALVRLRLKILADAMREQPPVVLNFVSPETAVSPAFYRKALAVAEEIVGKSPPDRLKL